MNDIEATLSSQGHSIQVRLYAEDPNKNFQPNTGILSQIEFPEATENNIRIDHWIEAGTTISANYDPMLAKLIVTEESRELALQKLVQLLADTRVKNSKYIILV